ncbi:LppX_LprAFG lipoprotein [Nocardioides anomalus]|uniref:LppX_LprAFG lipoprotein n=1 Tax=Nocardioides anomalus TaxID=2712223 RepID=A0A6G6WEJ8_9ACTN|nr:LppX_LprAFG lipoprotein [Nocardioides anomalus]QIG43662.1 LppX_LprAFG lipoprotein [Nocardioides anomalus]
MRSLPRHSRRPVRRTLAAAAATAALLALAGCGGDDSGGSKASDDTGSSSSASASTGASDDTSASADATDDATEDAGSGSGESVTAAEFTDVLQNALDEATTANLTMDLGQLGSGTGAADYTQDPPATAVKLSMPALGGDLEVRQVDGTIYLKGAQFGDSWVSIEAGDKSSPLGDLGNQLDPAKQFETYAAAVTEATHDGDDEVDGETLDKYTTTVDTAKLVSQMPQAAGGAAGLPDTLTQEWWFDDEGRIRQFTMDIAGAPIKLGLSDWGADVSVEAPPADQVKPFNPGAA